LLACGWLRASLASSLELRRIQEERRQPDVACGKFGAVGSPGFKFEAVSSGGNKTRDSRKACTASCPVEPALA
jgi:hypothetical protein